MRIVVGIIFSLCALFAQEKVIVGTNATFAPFEYIDSKNQIVGFDIDLIDLLSKEVGFEYEIVNLGFDALIPSLISKKIDIIAAGLSKTPQRAKSINFSSIYYQSQNMYISLASKDFNEQNIEGKTVAYQIGTTQEIAAKRIKNAKLIPLEDINAALLSLKYKKIDVLIVDYPVGKIALENNKELKSFLVLPADDEGFSIGFPKGRLIDLQEKINTKLDELIANGKLDELSYKWGLK